MSALSINHYICPPDRDVERFLDDVARAGARAVGLSRAALDEHPPARLRKLLEAHDLQVTSLNSAGYFTYADPVKRAEQTEVNLRLLDCAAELGADSLCVITGGMQESRSLAAARDAVEDGLSALDEKAFHAGVRLGLEPIHPVGLLTKGCINTISDACELIASLKSTGLILDLYHSWWDPDLSAVISNHSALINLIQICNVTLDQNGYPSRTPRLVNGVLSVTDFVRDARAAGYSGSFEFEIFARDHDGTNTAGLISEAVSTFEAWAVSFGN